MIEKSLTLQIRVSEKMKADIEEIAEKRGMTISDYVRYIITKDLENQRQ
jgi:antitoxin component of RelBE/YafQ-DinJ toxin-antitoxin module